MAGGWLTKQANLLTARFLNDVNDSVAGGTIFALPSGVQPPPYSQTIPGDRIVLDDASAFALSDTTVGTLFGGVYMYVGTLSTSTNSPGRGQVAYWGNAQLPPNTTSGTLAYTATADVQPSPSVPTFIAGIFINAPTKGNFCWIQVAGVASVLYDQTLTGGANIGLSVTAKLTSNASTPGSADVGVTAFAATTLATLLGVAVSSPVASTISQVIMTRGMFCGRI